jgi:hypothetical protein
MNEFIKRIKASKEINEGIEAIEKFYSEQSLKLEFRDKVASAMYLAILDINTNNEKEEKLKNDYIDLLNKVIYNYDELQPLIEKKLKSNKKEER